MAGRGRQMLSLADETQAESMETESPRSTEQKREEQTLEDHLGGEEGA